MLKGKQAARSGGWRITNERFAFVLSDKQFKCSLMWRPGKFFIPPRRERERMKGGVEGEKGGEEGKASFRTE